MDNIEEKPMSENDRKKEYLKTYRRMALREKSSEIVMEHYFGEEEDKKNG